VPFDPYSSRNTIRTETSTMGTRPPSYETYFFSLVQDIQSRGLVAEILLYPDDDVPAVYGVSRYLRQGYATYTTNVGIGDADQKQLERLRYVETAEGRTSNFQGGTNGSYSDINLMLKTLLSATKKL
jgi:hypothetical protein